MKQKKRWTEKVVMNILFSIFNKNYFMYINDIWRELDNKDKFWNISIGYIYWLNSEIWKTISDIKTETIYNNDWRTTITFSINWTVIWFIAWYLENNVFFIDELATINLNVWLDSFYTYWCFEEKLAKESIWILKIKNLWTNIFINFILNITQINLNHRSWIEYVELFPTKTSKDFYLKLKYLLLELWIIKRFEIKKVEIEWEPPAEFFRFYI